MPAGTIHMGSKSEEEIRLWLPQSHFDDPYLIALEEALKLQLPAPGKGQIVKGRLAVLLALQTCSSHESCLQARQSWSVTSELVDCQEIRLSCVLHTG